MDDLKPEEIDALIRALENGGRLDPPNNLWGNMFRARCVARLRISEIVREDEVDPSNTTDDVFDRLTDSGTLLAQSLKREREATAWRPIETAPKDGTEILIRIAEKQGLPGKGCVYVARYFDGDWRTAGGWYSNVYVACWLPLPPPPEPE